MLQSIISIIMLVVSFLNVGTPETYQVINILPHAVVVEDTQGNTYNYYQEVVTVQIGDQAIDVDGQLLRADNNNIDEYFVEDDNILIKHLHNECLVISQDFIIHIPYSLAYGDMGIK